VTRAPPPAPSERQPGMPSVRRLDLCGNPGCLLQSLAVDMGLPPVYTAGNQFHCNASARPGSSQALAAALIFHRTVANADE
jgi:hypothetical protein